MIYGLTVCPTGNAYINESERLEDTSLAHEMVHMMQDCQARGAGPISSGNEEDHLNWKEDGIYSAIEEVRK